MISSQIQQPGRRADEIKRNASGKKVVRMRRELLRELKDALRTNWAFPRGNITRAREACPKSVSSTALKKQISWRSWR